MKKIISKVKIIFSRIFFTFCFWSFSALAFADGDPLAPAKDVITQSVGKGTTIWWIVLVVEFISGVISYGKTKNPVVLTSFIVIMIVTSVFWAVLG